MKRFFFFLFCIIALLSFFWGISALFFDDLQTDIAKDNFNVVLITIDALRPDHLSCYGYSRKTSPAIDKIAEKSIIFENAIAPSSWTLPSIVSLFTSVYPINHGVIHGMVESKGVREPKIFSDEFITLTEVLKAHGYTTFAVTTNFYLSKKFGIERGFDYFKYLSWSPAQQVNEIIYSWENEIKKSNKFFLWVHYIDPHWPYHPRGPWIDKYIPGDQRKDLALLTKQPKKYYELLPILEKHPELLSSLVALYDSEVNYVDSYLGELIQKFYLDESTLIIITSDHGENFLEHGMIGHTFNLYQETIHIPLIVKLPHSSKKEIINKQVNLVDIMPSILHLLNINSPEQTLGESFWEKNRPEYNFSEVGDSQRAIMTPEWKYIYNYSNKTEQLFNIKSDPLELNNLADKKTNQRNQLKEKLFKWVSNSKKYPTKRKTIQLSPQEKEKLKSLGYIK